VLYDPCGKEFDQLVLCGIIKPHMIENAEDYAKQIIELATISQLKKIYELTEECAEEISVDDFLVLLARKFNIIDEKNKQLDLNLTAKKMIVDWQRGKIPF